MNSMQNKTVEERKAIAAKGQCWERDEITHWQPLPAPAAQADADAQPSTCTWSLDDEDSSTWSSSCGELWSFIDGGPKENRVKYCHHCGKPVDVARAADKKEPT